MTGRYFLHAALFFFDIAALYVFFTAISPPARSVCTRTSPPARSRLPRDTAPDQAVAGRTDDVAWARMHAGGAATPRSTRVVSHTPHAHRLPGLADAKV